MQDEAWKQVEIRFQKIENGLTAHGRGLKSLAETQKKQGLLMKSLDTNMDGMITLLMGTPPAEPITQENETTETTHASNHLHNALEGMES